MPNTKYIDQTFYNYNYKPAIQASIQDQYINGPRNAANFESFSERASEVVNRLTDNTVENLGGVDALTNTPQNYIKKATAALVEYWFLNDFNLNVINASFTDGSISTQTIKEGDTVRAFIPETVLILVQTSGLSSQTLVGVDSENMLADRIPGLSVKDVLTVDEAFAYFQQKGNYDNNFHKDLDIQSQLTGSTLKRYVLIGESAVAQKSMTFGLIGGNELDSIASKLFITVNRNPADLTEISLTESAVVTLNPKALTGVEAPGEPQFLALINGDDKIEIYIELQSDKDIADVLITDISPDDDGVYGVLGSSLVKPSALTIAKMSVVQSATGTVILQAQIDQNKQDILANETLIGSKDSVIQSNAAEIVKVDAKTATNAADIATDKQAIAAINGALSTINTGKLDQATANDEFIRREKGTGYSTEMKSGYTATEKLDVLTKASLDVVEAAAKAEAEQIRVNVAALQAEITASENVWTGNQGLTGDANEGTADFSSITGDDGNFDFTNGRTVFVSVFDTKTNLGGTVQVIVGKSNFEVKSLASGGGTSESVGVKVDINGVVHVNESTTGIDVSQDIIIDRLSQSTKITATGSGTLYALKTELTPKQNKVDARLTAAGFATDDVVEGVVANKHAAEVVSTDLGDKTKLTTAGKADVVEAINEIDALAKATADKTIGITNDGADTSIDGQTLYLDDTSLTALEAKLGI